MIIIKSKNKIKEKILKMLLETKKPVTVSFLAEKFSLSNRTIRNYLNEIEYELKVENIKLTKKPNVGVYLEGNENDKNKLKSKLGASISVNNNYSPEYRRNYILKTLLKNKFTYTMQLFAEELYCSKGTIANDLIYVQNWLEKRGLKLKKKQNQGLWIEGNETNYRRAMMDYFFRIDNNNNSNDINEIQELDYRIDFVNYKKIKNLFPRINLLKIQKIIQQSEKDLGYYFTDQAFINLITHIAITIERVKNNNEVKMKTEFLDSLKGKFEFEIAKSVVKQLENEFKLQFPLDEIGYISLHMLGAKIQEDVSAENYGEILEGQDKQYVDLARDIIFLVSDILSADLTHDQLLLTSLVLHLRPTIARLKHGLRLRNPMLETIKREYTSIFGATWASSSIFERKLGIPINEDEVGYISLHIAVALERHSSKVKTIVVCSSGIGTSQLITAKIGRTFNELEIIATIPFNCLNKRLLEEADLIISTIPNILNSPKLVYVTTFLNQTDINNIKNNIQSLGKNISKGGEDISDNEVIEVEEDLGIIDEDLCFIEENIDDFKDIINYYGNLMIDKKYVKDGFCENVLKREEKSTTVVGKGIAIPHSEDNYVIKSKICIVKLVNPIYWNEQEIKLILILGLRFKDIDTTKMFFKYFYTLLDNEKVIEMIMKTYDKKEIIKLLKYGGNDSEQFNR